MSALLDLPNRVAELERRLAELEARPDPELEALQPNVLTEDLQGNIGAKYTGLINALGLVIPAGTVSSPPSTNRGIWTRGDGATVADIWGGWQAEGFGTSSLELSARTPAGDVGDFALVAANAGTARAVLIQSDGTSSLPQLDGTAARKQLLGPPGLAHCTAGPVLAVGWTFIPMGALDLSGGGRWSIGPNGGLVVPTAGIYLVYTQAEPSLNNSPQRFAAAAFAIGGANPLVMGSGVTVRGGAAGDAIDVCCVGFTNLNANTEVVAAVYNNGGNTSALVATQPWVNLLGLMRIS